MTFKKEEFKNLLQQVKEITDSSKGKEEKLNQICQLLKDNVPYYNWVGFYLADESKKELFLGPFVGEPTEHTRIKFGQGICGQAAEHKEIFVIQDVTKETNYLSCSPKVKAEIVIPIFKDKGIVGELDIDSHKFSPFTEEDRKFLKTVCESLSKIF